MITIYEFTDVPERDFSRATKRDCEKFFNENPLFADKYVLNGIKELQGFLNRLNSIRNPQFRVFISK